MKQKILCYLFLMSFSTLVYSQPPKPIIVVLTPLYLDSIDGIEASLSANIRQLKYSLTGLEFYNGIQMAIDSLAQTAMDVEVQVIDSKLHATELNSLLQASFWQNVKLIIASFTNKAETVFWAKWTAARKIPLVSATYPNEAGIKNNPYFILLNPTLRTHIQGVHQWMTKAFSLDTILVITKKGATEQFILNELYQSNKNKKFLPLNYKIIELKDNFSVADIAPYLAGKQGNIILFCAVLEESFGENLVQTLDKFQDLQCIIIGMPNWSGIKTFNQPSPTYSKTQIIYSTAFSPNTQQPAYLNFQEAYLKKFHTLPSEWTAKGYEFFLWLAPLVKYPILMKQLLQTKQGVFNHYEMQANMSLSGIKPAGVEYVENKQLYFIKKQNGQILSIHKKD